MNTPASPAVVIGIDLGTTNSVVAHLVDGRPIPIAVDGSAIVPSVVHLDEAGVFRVGREARNLELSAPERTVRSVKRKMGQDSLLTLGEKTLRPEEISAEILKALKRAAEGALRQAVHDAVITVPAYFDDAQRHATLRAGELAGLNVLRLLNEPTSASLVYDRVASTTSPDAAQSELILVYDLGGGTFDVSLLEVFEGVREVRATAGNSALGGDDFDDQVLALFLQDLKAKQGVEPRDDARAMARLRRLAEDTKIRLSADTTTTVREEFLTQVQGRPVHLELTVTRRELEDRIAHLLESTFELTRKVLSDAGVEPKSVSRVCLVGGSTRIPLVRARLEEIFGAVVHEDIDPDLAVGLGAAVQAGLLKGQQVGRILVDVAAHSLGIKIMGRDDDPDDDDPDTFAPVLRRNTVLPAERAEEFYTMVDDQERLEVEVFQGEAKRCSENTRIGSFRFDLQPAPAHTPVRFLFAYDLNGVIRVSVSQPQLGNEKTVALKVADAGKQAQVKGLAPADSAVLRKARRLLAQLSGARHRELEALIAAAASPASPQAREEAEDALLDFFVDLDDDKDSGKPDEASF